MCSLCFPLFHSVSWHARIGHGLPVISKIEINCLPSDMHTLHPGIVGRVMCLKCYVCNLHQVSLLFTICIHCHFVMGENTCWRVYYNFDWWIGDLGLFDRRGITFVLVYTETVNLWWHCVQYDWKRYDWNEFLSCLSRTWGIKCFGSSVSGVF